MMDLNQDPQQVIWHVTRVEDTFVPAGIGVNGRAKRVWFKLIDDTESYVDVALSDFTVAKVAAAIQAHVDAMIDVLQLKGHLL